MANGRTLMNAPAFVPPLYGLLSVAQDMTANAPTHWRAGITYQPLCARGDTTFDECLAVTGVGDTPEPPEKAPTFESNRRAATPFVVYVRKDCSAPTFWNGADQEIPEGLTEAEAWQVERTFWTGAAAGVGGVVHPHLAADAELVHEGDTLQLEADVVSASPVDIVEALGLVEKALADCYDGQGVIHVPVQLAAAMASQMLLVKDGPRLRTPSGNLVALGRGYSGSGPDGTTAEDTVWIYGTGAVFYARSEIHNISNPESFNRDDNTLEKLGERAYILAWDCCLVAAPVSTAG